MKKYIKFIVAGLVAVIFIGTFVFLWIQSQPKPVEYEEFTPKVTDIKKTTVVTGKIQPRNEISVKPQISGIITEIYKEAGQMVTAGEVIAKVKVIPDMSSLASAQARVRLAQINLKQAKTDLDREKLLYDKGLVSADEYEKVRIVHQRDAEELQAANDNLEVVREGVSSSNADMSSTLIRSTISGLILDIPVKVGNTVILSNTFNDGTTIATVADMGNLIFRGKIDETEVGRVHEGMPVEITIGALTDVKLEATLEYISPKATEQNGANQFEIKAAISLPQDITIRSGYSANAKMVLQRANKVLTVPEAAVEFKGDSTFVYVLTSGDASEQKFNRIPVVTGLSDGLNIEIKNGLKGKETVRGIEIKE